MAPEVAKWLELADLDYGVAEHLLGTYHPIPVEIVCYHCQQAAEKAVKALILYFCIADAIPKKHDISYLLDQVKGHIAIDEKYYDYADTLTPYGVAVRYPNELQLEERHARNALYYAGQILAWAKGIITE